MRVAATAIILETDPEHAKLKALFDSTEKAGADFYVIGLDDKGLPGTDTWIRKRLKKKRCLVFPFTFEDDFAKARNLTLAHLPKDIDWWYWIDSDDTLEMSEGKTVQQFLAEVPETTSAVFCNYDYDKDEYGNSSCILTRGRFYRSAVAWQWQDRVHEDVYPPKGRDWPELGLATSEAFLWKHDTTKRDSAAERNFRLLAKSIEEDPSKPRYWYYLGNQHFAVHDWQEAVAAYDKYLSLSNWTEQKWDALIRQAIAYRSLFLYAKAIECDTKALLLVPQWADSYFGLGETYTRMGEWEKARQFGELGVLRTGSPGGIPDPTVFVNMNAYKHNPFRWMAVAYFNLNDNERALKCLERAAEARPEPELLRQIEHLRWAMAREQIIQQGLNLAAGLMRRNEPLKAREVLRNLPAGESENPNVQVALRWVNSRLRHLEDKVAYANLYFTEEEHVRPEDAIESIDELPRMKWLLGRLKAMGAHRILEVGIGNAAQALYLAQNGIQVVGIDIDRRRVRDANLAALRMGLVQSKEVDFGDEEEHAYITVPNLTADAQVQFHYCDVTELEGKMVTLSDDSEVAIMDLGPFDAVAATELLEHVPDPAAVLSAVEKASSHVFVSTPDGSYDGPQEPNEQHVRMYAYADLVRLISSRGRIVEVHDIPSPYLNTDVGALQADLVAEYVVGETLPQEAVVIWCPDTGQEWTPDFIHRGGIGGSETAVIHMAEELARRGKRVTVYAECEGVWSGVRYALSRNFRPQPCELFVSWRSVGPLPLMAEFADRRFLWTHDIHFGEATEEQLRGVTVLALSKWHKDFLMTKYPNADVVVTSNGIDPERFDRCNRDLRKPHHLIYAHSPDRGLDRVLRLFPKVREVYPDATLSVFYGFDLARQHDPAFVAEVERLAKQSGVTLHGRVDQDRLAEEYLRADAVLYPAVMPNGEPFMETNCISITEALAAGCFPVISDHGALREKPGAAHCRLATFEADALFQLLAFWRRPLKEQKNIRDHGYADPFDPRAELGGRRWALTQTWTNVADQWRALIAPKVEAESAAD